MSDPIIANSDIAGAVAANMARAIVRRYELDILSLNGPQVGQVWEQVKGELTGRRGKVIRVGYRVRLATPTRVTSIKRSRFITEWRLEEA